MNYSSAVIFEKGYPLEIDDKKNALKVISDHLIPNRCEVMRQPNEKESTLT